MIKVTLKDGSVKEFEAGLSVYEIAKSISEGLARNACCGVVNGKVCDLREEVKEDVSLSICTFDSQEGKDAVRHSISHVLAYAVKRLFPETKLAIGPSIATGFYYDFDKDVAFSAQDLEKLEAEMKKIIKENPSIEKFELPRNEALELMKDEPYKVELINDLGEDEIISFYKLGEFTDLCAGPHVMSLKPIKAIKLIRSAGAYWKGDEKNKMLTRIYGTAFLKKSELDEYLDAVEEAKKRDHNKLGRELKLFTTDENVGQGLPLLMPKGAKIVQTLQRWVEDEEERRGYVLTKTPLMAKSDLYKISGHWDHYKDGMFVLGDEEKDEEVFALRPMTCPFQYTIYNAEQHSYRDLPIRYGETSTLFRNESSGEMHGLIRVRQFTLADGHLIVTPEQLEEEFKGVLELIQYLMKTLGIDEDISYRFSKWDPNNTEKYINDPEAWNKTQDTMRTILDHLKINYVEADDEAAFYGPKLDLQCRNVHGKEDTLFTVQIDFALAERFDMSYIDKNGEKKRPYIIHRSSIGCYERTLAMLIEKYAGAFPTWLSPVQVKVLPISDKYNDYAESVVKSLRNKGVRIEADYRAEKIGYKIREARLERTPYILVVGEKEAANNEVSVRSRKNDDEGAIKLDAFTERLLNEIATKER
ncbi:threonine--tRNA ligase [Clostridium cagae]|uniref:Threonine--tRNA ligase n=1 Tax=Clostridium botulinum (strain Eklund 17B / Type B) TaxID=935198 RepID=SYT_CLOBB|nr:MULTISPECIES: threonine--tRNA ligase [Clostridium]B2TIT5.1 RecName: Full=Threonine--tRNA ligase; AltName: Full=Threonyl-tRNA synthetase; Short=ThrRS [Clostridium botulinum B str. Eklund 17B (NRP)]ACD22278.1 threonine--tRNA ligase [Clostridium botulinum B str. Eklund 17B (NRP)]MBN1054041.1 threonine--tRNA ligase [Clostridium botulinum]MBY6977556.1 threonine--tRNA ligase [Clostridium botulinum]MBY7001740.1 threonine--tRNA ligase [Clostridium botulinum]MCR1275485.1 threonine--tRNA ligase [Clo